MRFWKKSVALAAMGVILATAPTFAMTGEEEHAMGRQQMVDYAAQRGWKLENWGATNPIHVNIFDELIQKCGREQDMINIGIPLYDPLKVDTNEIKEENFAGSYSIVTTGAIKADSNAKLDGTGIEHQHRAQDIYTNSIVAGLFSRELSGTIEGNVRNTWNTAGELNNEFDVAQQMNTDDAGLAVLGNILHQGIQKRVNDMHFSGIVKRIVNLYDGVPYLSSTGYMMSIRRAHIRNSLKKDKTYDTQNDAISDSVNNKASIEGYASPLLYINGKRIPAYSEASEIREDIENADRVLYVYGKIAQAMRNDEWSRDKAVLKRESEIFSDSPDNNYVYLCVPLPEKYLTKAEWPTLMVIDKFYIPKQYMNATDVPYNIQEEKDKLNALLAEMS